MWRQWGGWLDNKRGGGNGLDIIVICREGKGKGMTMGEPAFDILLPCFVARSGGGGRRRVGAAVVGRWEGIGARNVAAGAILYRQPLACQSAVWQQPSTRPNNINSSGLGLNNPNRRVNKDLWCEISVGVGIKPLTARCKISQTEGGAR